ncbi:Rha family transcriptional regulator [Bacillus thuringiensis]|uniref:Rha family transcriptional regulator n=1 Tax=Bacillus thuringiensis TaxID=1428 RepID=UPI0005AF14EB|nr:Rha family transcriptional regulator [Bacillus thuringiensis]KIP27840.1 phage regulatory, Rha family protein [Bacillus thuringiensis serovar morrisoni]MCT6948292.1 Rha family transcriptional regulator [Bacillus thuringiensis]MED2080185.1 Rha family transcriptional regulator [Bacillus thuringiensis]MEE2015551.1 Rha family transcriptional regulator [Bacillus thuringiensis]NUW49285.1 Rha family transcriptional regulator [Bacillus thuringiensis]
MTNLVFLNNNNEVVTDSLMVAEVFGKKHHHVLDSIKDILPIDQENGKTNFRFSSYRAGNRNYPKYDLTKDGFTVLVMGFTGKEAMKFKMMYIEEFNRMESYIKEKQTKQVSANDKLRLLMEAAVETHEIAMETKEGLAIVKCEVEELQNTMTIDYREQSVLNQAKKRRVEMMWKERGELSKYDTKQKMHSGAWKDVYIRFGVASYRDIAKVDFDNALNFINSWIPLSF